MPASRTVFRASFPEACACASPSPAPWSGSVTRALDEFTRNKLDADLLDLWRERDLSIVFVTHSIYEAVFLSTRVVVMAARPGRISRVIDIDAPWPRDEEFRGSPRFAALCAELSRALRDASEESGSAAGGAKP